MRTRHDIDQKLLAELYYQYINEEEDFIKELFYSTDTKLGRVYVQEEVLTNENEVTILDYERVTLTYIPYICCSFYPKCFYRKLSY